MRSYEFVKILYGLFSYEPMFTYLNNGIFIFIFADFGDGYGGNKYISREEIFADEAIFGQLSLF